MQQILRKDGFDAKSSSFESTFEFGFVRILRMD